MKHLYLIPAFGLLLLASCKKDDEGAARTCYLTSIRNSSTVTEIKRTAEGYLYALSFGQPQFFNGGTLSENVEPADTTRLDAQGRLSYLSMPFSGPSGRQIRTYEYNDEGQVTRTHTNTGTGLDYLSDLSWQQGDPVRLSYYIAGTPQDRVFLFTYYQDKESPDQYSSRVGMNQVGAVYSRHLIKSRIGPFNDTVYYAYSFDEQGRIKEMYRDTDRSGWGGYKRGVDTTRYRYTCY